MYKRQDYNRENLPWRVQADIAGGGYFYDLAPHQIDLLQDMFGLSLIHIYGKGSNLVEIVSTCSSGWKMTPEKSNKWMEEHMFPFYPLGDLKDRCV